MIEEKKYGGRHINLKSTMERKQVKMNQIGSTNNIMSQQTAGRTITASKNEETQINTTDTFSHSTGSLDWLSGDRMYGPSKHSIPRSTHPLGYYQQPEPSHVPHGPSGH